MVSEGAKRWIEAGRRVVDGERVGLRCPQSDDGDLVIESLPAKDGRGEYRLRCQRCGAENFVPVTDRSFDARVGNSARLHGA